VNPGVQCIEGVNYMHVKKSGLYLVITSRYNISPCMILELLERLTRCGMIGFYVQSGGHKFVGHCQC
jgi:hypothetical protein